MLMAAVFPFYYSMYSAPLAMNAYVGQAVLCMLSALKQHMAYRTCNGEGNGVTLFIYLQWLRTVYRPSQMLSTLQPSMP